MLEMLELIAILHTLINCYTDNDDIWPKVGKMMGGALAIAEASRRRRLTLAPR
jgi:hypothetical protein